MEQAAKPIDHEVHHHLNDIVRQIPVFAVATLLLVACARIMADHSVTFNGVLMLASVDFYFKSLMLVVIADSTYQLFRHRPAEPIRFLRNRYTSVSTLAMLIARMPLFGVLVVFMPAFSQTKSMIPLFNSYDWDATFIAWDQAIFGMDAWLFFQPVLGFPIVTWFLNLMYHVWMLLVFPGTLVILLAKSCDKIRNAYFLGFVLIWTIIGFVMAAWLASVGPCFLEPIMGDGRFLAQTAYLRAANEHYPIMVLNVQEMLLEWYRNKDYGLGRGITAMPSMHVAMSFLFFLAMREVSPWAGRVFFAFFLLIWVASVHLGYHYFVDGLVSVVATSVIWWGSKALLKGWEKVSPTLNARARGEGQIASA
jgi:hypothetical protein